MIDINEPLIAVVPLRAIKIDPEERSIRVIDIMPDAVAGAIHSDTISTIDLGKDHCLVMDDGSHTAEHASRFRFSKGYVSRPCFGPAIILGMEHGNWMPATLELAPLQAAIIWEKWDGAVQDYAVHASGKS
jgi:hypothetical protein